MLIEFRVSNYRSIGDEQVLSLIPTSNQKESSENIFKDNKFSSLNGVAIYGANGSGKSNLLQALGIMNQIIRRSAATSSTTKLPFDPFLLRDGFQAKDTVFEIVFVQNNVRYRYGFSYNLSGISKEWLFRKVTGRETKLFEREKDIIDVSLGFKGSYKLIDLAIEATRDNTLFLSICDMLNIEEAKKIMQWFSKMNIVNGQNSFIHEIQTASLLQQQPYSEIIREYLKSICLNIKAVDVQSRDIEETDLPSDINDDVKSMLKGSKQIKVMAEHIIYDLNANPTPRTQKWDWDDRESSGSQKAMHLSGPVLWTLANGGILVVDEIEAFLHPIMTLNTIEIFLNPESNTQKAQLIFATHDTNLLNYARLRRDQIYFAEKNSWESTELFSLSDFKYIGERDGHIFSEKERPDADKEKRYIEGRYGAIPALGEFNKFISELKWQEEER